MPSAEAFGHRCVGIGEKENFPGFFYGRIIPFPLQLRETPWRIGRYLTQIKPGRPAMDTVFLCDQTELCISQAAKVLQYARHLLPGGFHVKGGVNDDQYSSWVLGQVKMVGTAKHPERKQRDGQPDRKWFHEPPLHLRV